MPELEGYANPRITVDEPRPCGCCPYCGALPSHQDPPQGRQSWQHQHSPIRERMAEPPPVVVTHETGHCPVCQGPTELEVRWTAGVRTYQCTRHPQFSHRVTVPE